MSEVKSLTVLDGKSLLELDLEPPKFIVSRLLPVGLSILSGSAKVGKSWFALWLCEKISKGESVWDFETQKSTVLYLALEDTLERLHFRLSCLSEEGSDDSFFAVNSEKISENLIAQLELFVEEKKDTGLIVIDTLQKIRSSSSDKSTYAFDYEEMSLLKSFADKHKIAVLLIHHTRKMPDSDPFNQVSGSTGIIGSADAIYILEKDKRSENKAKLHITGRDVEDMVLLLEFDKEATVWRFLSYESGSNETGNKLVEALAKFLADCEQKTFTGTASELLEKLKNYGGEIPSSPNNLTRLIRTQILTLEKRYKINVLFTRTNSARLLNISIGDGDGDDGNI